MNNIPYELLFGVDIAVKKLRPGAKFQLEGTRFTQWTCPNGSTAPSWDEVMQQLKEDETAANDWIAANT